MVKPYKEIFSIESSSCLYTFYVDNRVGSLERTRRTNVGAVDMHASFDI